MSADKTTKTLWTLDGLVCASSIGIAAYWGSYYDITGSFITGVLGLLVGMGWCWCMRKVVRRFAKNIWPVFISGVLLGVLAGLVAGIFMHNICWPLRLGYEMFYLSFPEAAGYGVEYGIRYGAYNGTIWGLVYCIAGYAMYRSSGRKSIPIIKKPRIQFDQKILRRPENVVCLTGAIFGAIITWHANISIDMEMTINLPVGLHIELSRFLLALGVMGGIFAGLLWIVSMRLILSKTCSRIRIISAGSIIGILSAIVAAVSCHLMMWRFICTSMLYVILEEGLIIILSGWLLGLLMGLDYSLVLSGYRKATSEAGGKNV